MPSNANSTSPAAERSRFFTVRLIRAVRRFVFSRRMVWTLVVLASLVVLFYQYENWNGARELAATRQRMIARAGTENYMDLLPPDVPDEENFYSIPEIVSWRVPDANAAGGFKYQFPGDRLLPEHFANPPAILEEPGCHRLDLEGWAKDQATAGYALPPDKSPAEALYSMLGDGAGIIPRLIAGLDRPQSLLIPSRRSIIAAAGGELAKTKIPAASSCFPTQRNLALHLRVAGLAGDAGRTRDLAGVMLRLADGMGHDITFVGGLVCMALNGVTLTALNEALACRTLTDADFRSLSDWLAAFDDVRSTERMFLGGLLATDAAFGSLVQALRENDQGYLETFGALKQRGWLRALLWGPSGWLDTNRAFLLEQSLAHAGTGEGEIWPSGAQGAIDVAGSVAPASIAFSIGGQHFPNPRRFMGCVLLPALSDIWHTAARNLFHRRCAILTCALHRHRLAHGVFPESFAALDGAFLPSRQNDPAKSGAPLNYRRMEKGFLLWSVGDDRNDDSGDAAKDWIWRHGAAERP